MLTNSTGARVVKRDGIRIDDLDQVHVPDPVAQEIARLENEINILKSQQEVK